MARSRTKPGTAATEPTGDVTLNTADQRRRYELALQIGGEAIRQGKWQHALTSFQAALTGLPNDPRVYDGLGDTHLALGDRGRALSCYEEASRLAPGVPSYPDKAANLQERLGLLEEAARTLLLVGDMYWFQKQPEVARARWERAVALAGDMPGVRERLAMYYRERGDEAGMIRQYLDLSEALLRAGRCLTALHVCYTALSLRPDDPQVWDAAERAWRCVAVRDGGDGRPATRVEQGDLVNAANEFAQWQLTAEFRQSTLRQPGSEKLERNVLLRQAVLHEGQGRAGLAITCYEGAIANGLDLPAAFFALGLLYRLVRRREDARRALLLAARHPFYRRAVDLLDQ